MLGLAFRRFAPVGGLLGAFFAFVLGNAAFASADPAPQRPNVGTLTATGRVLLSDGSPAANALITALGNNIEWRATVRADAQGRFQLRHVFGNYCGIHASTPDCRQQAWLAMPAGHARSALERPLELKLAPAQEISVLVKSARQPAGGIRVVVIGTAFRVEGISGPDGRASLWLPQDQEWNEIVGWDPKLGGAEINTYGSTRRSGPLELSLHTPRAHTIRVIDQNQNPMRDLEMSLTCSTPAGGFGTDEFEGSSVRTDAKGEVTVPWVPADVTYLDPQPVTPEWKVDRAGLVSKASPGVTSIHVRRRHLVTGKLILPEGANPKGILVEADGFASEGSGDISYARVQSDGTFQFWAAANHGYAIGISDDGWACDLWTGVALTSDAAEPAEVTLHAYPATPLTLHVTWGAKAEPWTSVFVYGEQTKEFDWTDAQGEHHSCEGCLRTPCPIEADGTVHLGVARGDYQLHFSSGFWRDSRRVAINSDAPVSVTLHRPWKQHRLIAGRLTRKGSPYVPTATTSVRIWSIASGEAIPAETKVLPNGQFTATVETRQAAVYAFDPTTGVNAFRWIGSDDAITNRDLELVPTGSYSGQVTDKGKPEAGCRVRLVASNSDPPADVVLSETQCDEQGRFTFDRAPTDVSVGALVVLPVKKDRPPADFTRPCAGFVLKPGEHLKGDRLEIALAELESVPRPAAEPQYDSAVERLADLTCKARLLDLRVLVAAVGDASKPVEETWRQLVDAEDVKESRLYLRVWVPASEARLQSSLFSQLKLRPPKAEEMLLVVLDGDGRQLDFLYLTIRGSSPVFRLGANFLKKHAPPPRDPETLITAAREQARASGRRVWILASNPRERNCFRLAQWLEDHQALLDRDYVFVKLLEDRDAKIDDLSTTFRIANLSAPWFVITDEGGRILARSDTPQGAIGFPVTAWQKRHFRTVLGKTSQKLKPADIDRLIQSLGE